MKNKKTLQEIKISAAIITKNPFHLYIRIEGDAPKAMNKVMTSHFKKNWQDSSRWKMIVGSAVERHLPWTQLEHVTLTMKRSSYRFLDYDGLVASFKPLIDGLKDLVIQDDSYKLTGPWRASQEFRPKKDGPLIEIWVEERKEVAS